ncbi:MULTISPECIES: DUF669 domain-containing protein [Enterococcus]|uniref:DUF669 domain-containing protein n=1 Tax=Enterococcus TaxID=1350 RepID=UPI0011D2A097|nr:MULTISPECIES: DUF669 domain-containing protein [Enterococcus]EMF0283842.1 hypothetical protein [Enterococcus hirae]MBA5276272.1 hypothetical protein [Enterococcus hirae]MDT6519726.1 DUF669 domain-containing protein [Enterococcus faecium]
MGLKDLANEVLAGFDPKTDDPNAGGFEGLSDGEYDVQLEKAEHKVFQSGWEALSFAMEVTVGESAGRKEFVSLGFDESAVPNFVLQKNIKLVGKLASVIGLQLSDDDWEDEETLAQAFQDGLGSQFVLKITSSPNKKDPSKPYKNYDFIPYDDQSELSTVDVSDISDEELPY